MHKQKIISKFRSGGWLLLIAAFMAVQIMPFIPVPKVSAEGNGEHNINTSSVSVSWTDSSTLAITAKAGAKFPGTNILISDVIAGNYTLQGGIVQETSPFDSSAGQVQHPYINVGGMNSPKYQCKNNGVIDPVNQHIGWTQQNKADDDNMRIDVVQPGLDTALLRVRFNPKLGDSPDYCYTQDLMVPVTATEAGTILGTWLDSANIQVNVADAGIYQLSTTTSKHFVSQVSGQGPCKDILVITGNDNNYGTPVTIYNQESKQHASDEGKGVSPLDKNCGLQAQYSGYVSIVDQANTAPAGSGLTTKDGTTPDKSCESSGSGVLNWLFCAVIDGVDGTIVAVDGIVDNMLSVDAGSIANNPKMYTLWSYFRNIASLLLVIVALVMIISQSIGNGS